MNKQAGFENNLSLIHQYRSGNIKAKEHLIESNIPLVKSVAQRFTHRGCELEDLISIGTVGLLKAVDGFDESLGYSFSTYAFPLITGEIKRHLRDDGIIKVSRGVKRNAYLVLGAREKYIKQNGREPKISELCGICSLSSQEIIEALEASSPVMSLQERVGGDNSDFTLSDVIYDEDKIESITEKLALREEIESLCDFDRKLIKLRYYKNLTQTQTAEILGISQVTVSRAEKKIIDKLRINFL